VGGSQGVSSQWRPGRCGESNTPAREAPLPPSLPGRAGKAAVRTKCRILDRFRRLTWVPGSTGREPREPLRHPPRWRCRNRRGLARNPEVNRPKAGPREYIPLAGEPNLNRRPSGYEPEDDLLKPASDAGFRNPSFCAYPCAHLIHRHSGVTQVTISPCWPQRCRLTPNRHPFLTRESKTSRRRLLANRWPRQQIIPIGCSYPASARFDVDLSPTCSLPTCSEQELISLANTLEEIGRDELRKPGDEHTKTSPEGGCHHTTFSSARRCPLPSGFFP